MDTSSSDSARARAPEAHKAVNKKRNRDAADSDRHTEPVLKKPKFATPPSTVSAAVAGKPTHDTTKVKKGFTFRYGNYAGYYGYRLDEAGKDPRIELLNAEWFHGKKILDIGCNTGVLSIRVAKKFAVESMYGVDIDKSLIDKANKNLSITDLPSQVATSSSGSGKQKFHGGGKLAWFMSSSDANPTDSAPKASETVVSTEKSPEPVISFEAANYIRSLTKPNFYDTIMCFSVVKWIHLNWGDAGLRLLFHKVHSELRENGLFILEIQPLSSYKKVKNLTHEIRAHYDAMQIKPDQFTVVAEQLGLKLLHTITPATKIGKRGGVGFSRPIHVFQKAAILKINGPNSTTTSSSAPAESSSASKGL